MRAVFEEVERSSTSAAFWDMMVIFGDEDAPLRDWEPSVRKLLNHREPVITSEAITILASRWKLPGFRDECIAFAHDENDEIRLAAVFGLADYNFRANDYDLAVLFMDILKVGAARLMKEELRLALFRGLSMKLDSTCFRSHSDSRPVGA